MKLKNIFFAIVFAVSAVLPACAITEDTMYIDNDTYKKYKKVTNEDTLIEALETMKGTLADFSYKAIMGENLSGKPIKVEYRNLGELNAAYSEFDALGWKNNKGKLYILINEKHKTAPKEAIAALLSHEALHQDEFNSLNEETYCWTLEAAVWTSFCEKNPKLVNDNSMLSDRENTIRKLFLKGGYTDKFIRKSVLSNAGYKDLPERSPGFENENL